MSILFIHIKELLQTREKAELKVMGKSMSELPHIKNAFLRINGDTIHSFGPMDELVVEDSDEVIDVTGKIILPTWCDSHSHVVYAGDRSQEFVDRIQGLSYEEIAEATDIKVNAIRVNLSRARKKVRDEFLKLNAQPMIGMISEERRSVIETASRPTNEMQKN